MGRNEDQFSAVWFTAKQRYKESTGKDLDSSSFPHPSTTEDLLTSLDAQNNDFKHFREKRGLVFNILQGVCKPIELVGNLAAGGASMVFPPSSMCFGAAMYLINAAHGVSASYDAIADLLGTLKASNGDGCFRILSSLTAAFEASPLQFCLPRSWLPWLVNLEGDAFEVVVVLLGSGLLHPADVRP